MVTISLSSQPEASGVTTVYVPGITLGKFAVVAAVGPTVATVAPLISNKV